MRSKYLPHMLAVCAALVLVAAACGGDDAGDPELVIGQVMPETGALAFLNAPMIVSIDLAVQDIQAAGGNVRLLTGDSATDPDVAPETVNRLLGEGAHVIVGAAASGVSQSFIQTLYDAQIPQCSRPTHRRRSPLNKTLVSISGPSPPTRRWR